MCVRLHNRRRPVIHRAEEGERSRGEAAELGNICERGGDNGVRAAGKIEYVQTRAAKLERRADGVGLVQNRDV